MKRLETINNIELRDESIYPDENVLRSVLGDSYNAYVMLLEMFNQNEMVYEWRYYRDGKAWLADYAKSFFSEKEVRQALINFPDHFPFFGTHVGPFMSTYMAMGYDSSHEYCRYGKSG